MFPDWSDERFPLYVYYVSRNHVPAKVRKFIDFIVKSLGREIQPFRYASRDGHARDHGLRLAAIATAWLRRLRSSATVILNRLFLDRFASLAANYVFIESKNSPLFLVLRSLSSRKSIASMVPIGLRMRRSTYIFLS